MYAMILMTALSGVVLPEPSTTSGEDWFLGRLAYRTRTEKNFSMYDYRKTKEKFLSLSEQDKRIFLQSEQMLSQQRRAMYQGTPQMRIQQTQPFIPQKPNYPTQRWQYQRPLRNAGYPYYNPNPPVYHHYYYRRW